MSDAKLPSISNGKTCGQQGNPRVVVKCSTCGAPQYHPELPCICGAASIAGRSRSETEREKRKLAGRLRSEIEREKRKLRKNNERSRRKKNHQKQTLSVTTGTTTTTTTTALTTTSSPSSRNTFSSLPTLSNSATKLNFLSILIVDDSKSYTIKYVYSDR